MNLISRQELKEKLDRGDDFRLVMVLGEWAFRAKHIPGSIHFNTPEEGISNSKFASRYPEERLEELPRNTWSG